MWRVGLLLISVWMFANGAVAKMVANAKPNPSKWHLIWSEEFDGKALDLNRWSYDIDCWGGGNEERQCYTDRAENLQVEDGQLKIIARREAVSGPALPAHLREASADPDLTAQKSVSSARIHTRGKVQWLYGRIEIRAKFPLGQGMWPAIWMLPADNSYGDWAASGEIDGEIDIVEAVNLGTQCRKCLNGVEDQIFGSLHFGGEWPKNKHKSSKIALAGDISDFHIYALEWRAGEFRWFVDGKHYATLTSKNWYSESKRARGREAAPFDQPFYLILNLAIGGSLPESRNEKAVDPAGFPKWMEVDYIRIYRETSDAQDVDPHRK